ncbi:DUF4340 domain-containing protein [Sorangium sp. So ce1078]|uniref:DUF4340 domain-containing protein n=1 Tax=Sorangium sp. So ce1078 TaxID=3133329 RepID=UPI003F5FAFCD
MRHLRRHATTLILVALAAAAAVALFVLDRGSVSTDEAERRKRHLFEAWRPDEITELTVTMAPPGAPPGAQQTARLTRGDVNDAGQRPWSVEIDGQRHPADEPTIDQLLGTLEFATAERRVSEEASDRAALGLAAPRLTIALAMGPRRERLLLGGSAPTPPGAVYAEVAGRGVFVVTKQLAAALDVPPDRFRSRSFVPYLPAELSGLTLDGEGGSRRFSRAPWGGGRGAGFRFAEGSPEGSGVRVSAPALDLVLSALGRMQAEAFLSEEEAAQAAASGGPRVTLTLLPSDPSARYGVIDVGGACPGRPDHVVAVRREPTRAAACVPASVLDPLTEDAARFVDLALVAAPLDEVAEVKLAAGDRGAPSLELARAGSEWHLRAPEDRPVPTETGRALVQAILDVRATRLLPAASDPEALGLDPPRATLRVVSTPASAGEGEPQERIETLEIGAEQAGVVRVRRLEDGAIAEIPASAAGALLPSEASLRSMEVFDFAPDQVSALRIERPGLVQRLRRTGEGAWQLVEPSGAGLAADGALADELAEQLAGLKAERWVAADTGQSYGLGAPRLVVEAELAPPPEGAGASGAAARAARVALGAHAGPGSLARAGDGAAVFVAPPSLEAAAGRLLLRRDVFLVPPQDIARVTLAPRDGKPVVLEGSPHGFTIAGAADEASAAATAARVRDALADLRAEGAVALGQPERHHGLGPPRLRVTIELARPQAAPAGEGGASPPRPSEGSFTIAIGAGDAFRGTNVFYARRDGVSAVYAIAQSRVRPLLEAAGVASVD